ncbi:MAG TPA: glycosyltransferase [Pseudonocardiaceae bacterium]|jgi:teichuronic acid biosynthesis glycosyltransferase TuaH|nr:glycosyltransferase [Pseudonocardiaceae bacterium]
MTQTDRPLTVLVSGANFDGVRGSEKAIAEALVRYTDILWVDPPVSPATPRRYRRFDTEGPAWRPRLGTERPGIQRLTPVVLPGLTRPGIRLTTWPLVRRQIRQALGDRVPFAVVACSFDDVLGGWPDTTRTVLYGTDDWVAGAELMGQRASRLRRQERRALARADLVLAITPELAGRWREFGTDPALVPNGCDPDAYRDVDTVEPAPLPDGFPMPVAGVVGQLNDRLDMDLLAAVADSGLGLLLVGPRDPGWLPRRWDALVARPNVHHSGAVPFAELPRWLARMDVGLTPYTDTAFNRASFPLKTLEYLAAGRPVVGSDLPAVRSLAAQSEDVTAVTGPAAFARAVMATADLPRTPDVVRRRQSVAARHSWAARALRMAGLLDLPRELDATNGAAGPMNGAGGRNGGHTDTPRRAG